MRRKDKMLYDFLIENSSNLTNKWLEMRVEVEGSIYSANVDDHIEQTLREQNSLTIKTIASSLLDDKTEIENNVKKWASIVAESRVDSETPIYEVLDAVNKFQDVIQDTVAIFAQELEAEAENTDILRWNKLINSAFNKLIYEFSKKYYEMTRKRLFSQEKLIHDLSTPIIPIFDSIAVLPLIGELDSIRAEKILNTLPGKCVEAQVEHLFIDLSGLPVVDTMVAHQLYQLISVLSLLGITSTISGLRPEVAQTSIQLGMRFENGRTFSTLKQALLAEGIGIK